MVLLIVRLLFFAAAVGFVNRALHAVGNAVGIHNNTTVRITRCTADGLNHRRITAQKAFLVRIQNRNQRYLRQIKAFAQQVNAYQHIKLTGTQAVNNFRSLNRSDFRMQIAHTHTCLLQIFRQILCHALRQCSHQHTLARGGNLIDFAQQIINLSLNRADFNLRVQQACRADNLLNYIVCLLQLILRRRSRNINRLLDLRLKLVKGQRSVIIGRRQTEAMLHQHLLTRAVTGIHSANLRQRYVRLINN